MTKINIEYRNIKEISGADLNPKDHDIGTLYNSINRFGFTNPLLINRATNKLLAGHGRLVTLLQMQQAGEPAPDRIIDTESEWRVPVYLIDIKDDAEAQAYLIADNRLTELGGWKNDELLISLKDIVEETGSLDGVGWDLEDIGQFSVPAKDWNKYTNNQFEDMGLEIVNTKFNGNLALAYDTVVR